MPNLTMPPLWPWKLEILGRAKMVKAGWVLVLKYLVLLAVFAGLIGYALVEVASRLDPILAWLVIAAVAWAVCGLIAFKVARAWQRKHYAGAEPSAAVDRLDRQIALVLAMLGVFGLVMAIIWAVSGASDLLSSGGE